MMLKSMSLKENHPIQTMCDVLDVPQKVSIINQ